MSATTSGISEAAKILADTQRRIGRHYDLPVTLSRRDAEDAVWEVWQATAAEWQSSDTETAITPEVRDAAIRFLELLPPGFPQPSVCGEPDGHIIVGFPAAKEDPMALAAVLAASIEGSWIPVPR